MKRLNFILLFSICAISTYAQTQDSISTNFQAVFDACINMREAVANNDTAAIKQSAIELKQCNTTDFYTLECSDDSIASLNGHLVFDEEFANGLAEGKDVYQKADSISKSKVHRGQRSDGKIFTKTCFVKAGKSTKYSFTSKGFQELAVVAESGGLVTLKVLVTNNRGLNVRYDDTTDVRKGQPQRKKTFNLPNDKRSIVELEIINCGKIDCSFVVISTLN